MAEHKPLPVSGYTEQSDAKVAVVNENKQIEEVILRRMDLMAMDPETDKKWLAEARMEIEKGFMALNRAIFKPKRTVLRSDAHHPDKKP